mmetsp:Transcript_69647/g.176708  ORF Transcript_69647/g.176708 Transcript_69647/m.176708 type:complete len:212 (+) Transcript_69647:1327-1962(+)
MPALRQRSNKDDAASPMLRSKSLRSWISLSVSNLAAVPTPCRAQRQTSQSSQRSTPATRRRGRSSSPHSGLQAIIQPCSPASFSQPLKFCASAKTYSPNLLVATVAALRSGDTRTGTPVLNTTSRQQIPCAWCRGIANCTVSSESTGKAMSTTPSAYRVYDSSHPGSFANFNQPLTVSSLQRKRAPLDFLVFILAAMSGSAFTTPLTETTW